MLADLLIRKDPMRIKHLRNIWRTGVEYPTRLPVHSVIDQEPVYMSLPEQQEEAALRIASLPRFRFLCRPATMEGEVSSSVIPISIKRIVREEGGYVFPDQELVARVQTRLAARAGIPAATILREQEARLMQGTPQKPPQTHPLPAADRKRRQRTSGVQTDSLPNGGDPEPSKLKTTPSLPTLDEQQKALLAFLMEHPETPVSGVYKGMGISVRRGTELRDTLREQGFLVELEVRAGTTGAGRPMKWIMPSVQAFDLFGIELPKGRGGLLHRQLQQLVTAGASTKGYSTQVEKPLANGTIVDAHLEKDGERIAVEIAIASKPEREIAHIKHCLAVGYDQVSTLFADETLLARTSEALHKACAQDEARRVRLLPVSQLTYVGYG